MPTTIRLFSARACPFAHRSRLVLSHKSVPFELVEIDLRNKPAWFDSTVSGYGKVPALEHGEVRIWESAIVNEYLDEVFPTPPLSPATPAQRAVGRVWVDYANTRFVIGFGRLLRAKTEADQTQLRIELKDMLLHLERAGFARNSGDGPFFFGEAPSLVDFAFYPWFERWPALQKHRDLGVPAECERLQRWRESMRELPAVREHENPIEYYVQRYSAA